MNEKRYTVSETVRLIGVESHVLRYWEEELGLDIQRNNQGHRVYTEKNIRDLQQARKLKEEGLQLKAIRTLMDEDRLYTGEWTAGDFAGIGQNSRELRQPYERKTDEIWTDSTEYGGNRSRTDSTEYGGDRSRKDDAECSGNRKSRAEFCENRWERTEFWAGGSENGDPEENASEGDTYKYEIVVEKSSPGNLERFTQLLRQMMEEVAAEQNKNLERIIAAQIREEMEQQYLQYLQALQELPAADMPKTSKAQGIRAWLSRLIFGEK